MRTLTMEQIQGVSGGDGVEAGVFGVGLGTSVAIGAALGPLGLR